MSKLPEPKLRDGHKLHKNELYPLGKISDEVVRKIGSEIVYLLYTGRTDMTGDDWANIFAKSIGADSLCSPLGIADVVKGSNAWSMKTVKGNPESAKTVRLISGRCSPDFSYGIENPHDDIQKTGDAVLAIFNGRVQISYKEHNPVRTCVLLRNSTLTDFLLFETELNQFDLSKYMWKENNSGNFEGKNIDTDKHCFTWQPHGSQFTIVEEIPNNAIRFKIKKPAVLKVEDALKMLKFDESWVTIIKQKQ